MSKVCDIAVIGAGPAGMMAAIMAAKEGAQVILLEHTAKIGTKLLSTGNGKCNLTNQNIHRECYHSYSTCDYYPIIEQFQNQDLIDFMRDLGVLTISRNGYVYPKSEQATTILSALGHELDRLGVEIIYEAGVKDILPDHTLTFYHNLPPIKAQRVILACGGRTMRKTGSDGTGYELARQLGHNITTISPALTKLKCTGMDFRQVAGVRAKLRISVVIADIATGHEMGEIQFTEEGVSGIAVFNLSGIVKDAINNRKRPTLLLDYVPELEESECAEFLCATLQRNPKMDIVDLLAGIVPFKIAQWMAQQYINSAYNQTDSFSESAIKFLVNLLKHQVIVPYDTADYEHAQVTRGGICLEEIQLDRLESTLAPGIYFAGEMLDVDGICGGYNLQWAFSSGHLAGISAARSLHDTN